jgi:hypothetical protein
MNKINECIREAESEKLWGQIQIDYQNGVAVVVRKTETYKLSREDNSAAHYDNKSC